MSIPPASSSNRYAHLSQFYIPDEAQEEIHAEVSQEEPPQIIIQPASPRENTPTMPACMLHELLSNNLAASTLQRQQQVVESVTTNSNENSVEESAPKTALSIHETIQSDLKVVSKQEIERFNHIWQTSISGFFQTTVGEVRTENLEKIFSSLQKELPFSALQEKVQLKFQEDATEGQRCIYFMKHASEALSQAFARFFPEVVVFSEKGAVEKAFAHTFTSELIALYQEIKKECPNQIHNILHYIETLQSAPIE